LSCLSFYPKKSIKERIKICVVSPHNVSKGIVKKNNVENYYQSGTQIGNDIHPEGIPIIAHELFLINKHEHEDENNRQQ
jgi:hypothetical protein